MSTFSEIPSSTSSPTLRRDEAGRLTILHDGKWVHVIMRPCFPWTRPREFLSLRDDEKNELALVRRVEDLGFESRSALEAALQEAHFTFRITRVREVEKDFELRVWHVETHLGPRRFVTKLEDWPEKLPGDRVLLRDLSGDLYVIEDLGALDKHSRAIMWAFVV